MYSENDSTRFVVNLGLIGTLLGVMVRFITHYDISVLIGAVGGLLVAFLLAAVRGEQF
jgi:multisubunit Na+/H+ antiporter MnhG subunit